MDRNKSALLATWASIILATLVVCLASIALLCIDQVKRWSCNQFSFACDFDDASAALVVFDVEPVLARPGDEKGRDSSGVENIGPPGGYPFSSEREAWRLLQDLRFPDLLTGYFQPHPETKTICFQYSELKPYFDGSAYDINDQNLRWRATYMVNESNNEISFYRDINQFERSIGFEFTARYTELHRDIGVTLHLIVENADIAGKLVLPVYQELYHITLPVGTRDADFLCPIQRLKPGQYVISIEASGDEGDWNKTIAGSKEKDRPPLKLTVQPVASGYGPTTSSSSRGP